MADENPLRPAGEGPAGRFRSPLAADPAASRGRAIPEAPSPTRTAFQRDRDRIVHSTAFRRLMHKTQVFVAAEGDHFRTRLTHSLEVAQIARSIARTLGLDEDLAEAIALAHDFGHTPFGHEGEDVLGRLMAQAGGFDHNAQTVRVVTKLERRYAAFDGLNLTVETLEGLVKHNGPVLDADGRVISSLPPAFLEDEALQGLSLAGWPTLEAQAAAIADDIAYDAHDIDDGLRAGFLTFEDLSAVPFLARILEGIAAEHGDLSPARRAHELVRRMLTAFIDDVVAETRVRAAAAGVGRAEDVADCAGPLVAFSAPMAAAERATKAFLFGALYRHPSVLEQRRRAGRVVEALFSAYVADPALLPAGWREGLRPGDEAHLKRRVADYIAGMTDRFAIEEHRRLAGHGGDEAVPPAVSPAGGVR